MGWTLAPALATLRAEVNARWPNRSKAYDGTIGDTAHQARISEHNPDALGVVRAIDLDINGVNVQQLLNAVIRDDRVHYVIHNRLIYSRTNGWKARNYTGASAHTRHVHISLRNRTSEKATPATVAAAAADTSSWFTAIPKPTPAPGVPSTGAAGTRVSLAGLINAARTDPAKQGQDTTNYAAVVPVERALVAEGLLAAPMADGHYGTATIAAYARWQRSLGYKGKDADGVPGKASLTALGKKHGFEVIA